MKLTPAKKLGLLEESEISNLTYFRKPIHNGWIVLVGMMMDYEQGFHPLGVTFVPDAGHSWKGLEIAEIAGPVQ